MLELFCIVIVSVFVFDTGKSLHYNEDSVDIYSGLENSPKGDGHRGGFC